jgi:hypothetical protein
MTINYAFTPENIIFGIPIRIKIWYDCIETFGIGLIDSTENQGVWSGESDQKLRQCLVDPERKRENHALSIGHLCPRGIGNCSISRHAVDYG